MNFLNPLVLIGLAAASIPLILHLINLRRQKTVEFSTLRFIKELQKTRIRRLKLKQILLLILRTLIIIFAVLAFARPTIETSIPYFENYSKTSAVILIDNSFSLDVSDEYGSRLKQVRDAAEIVLSSLSDGDEAAVIKMTDRNYDNYELSKNLTLLKEETNKINNSPFTANFDRSLKKAVDILEEAKNLNKEVFVISDAQENIFNLSNNDSLNIESADIAFNFIRIGSRSKTDVKNLSVDSLNIQTKIFQIDKQVDIEAVIHNSSETNVKDAILSLSFNDQRVAQRTVDIGAKSKTGISMQATPSETGVINASLTLENDELMQDNNEYFSFMIPETPQIALISDQGKNRFIETALKAPGEDAVSITSFTPGSFGTSTPANFDLIILAAGSYRSSDLNRITAYINDGGAAIVFTPESPEQNFKEFLKNTGIGEQSEVSFASNNPGKFINTDKMHPVFKDMFYETDDAKEIESPEIYNAFTVGSGIGLIELNNGNFLTEVIHGNGKLFYFGVTPDMQMSDFPLTGLFPALVYRSAMYLSASEISSIQANTGDEIKIKIPPKFADSKNYKIIDPNGNELFRQAADLPSGSVITLADLSLTGNYAIENDDRTVALLSLNTIPSESYFGLLDKSEAESRITERFSDELSLTFISNTDNISESIVRARMGTELWQIFVILALLCAAAEMFVQRSTKNEITE